ncbi:hypothetical protein [Pseudoflavitalea rhizosphaerae]|uniref:hypothetical protein n=1 Tax=Pseudoflavitalea rhizosphaerae TaxID=1884793 RepID=UPI000F8E4BFA|nr:hypothetical protein [Pseudoflavitalea rhizosphaerae]
MKKLYCLTYVMFFALLCSYSQVVIQLQVPPLGLTIKPQLWNLALMNGTRESLSVRIEMVMTDVASNQQVLTGTTRTFILPEGGRQVQVKDVLPVTYNSGSAMFAVDPNPDGFLPVGIFNVCYTLIGSIKGVPEGVLAEACETFEIEPLSPPMLVMPANNEHAESTRPLFTWLPPSPYQLFNNLRFDFTLVEVFPTQSPADAVQQNIPLTAQSNINFSSYQYPMSLPELDSSKSYAWRIVAKNGIIPVANSEVWTFRVKQYGADSSRFLSRGYYTAMRREDDASYIISGDVLKFSYLHEYADSAVSIRLTDITTAVRRSVMQEPSELKVHYGQNLHSLDLHSQHLTDKHLYLFELINSKQEKWYLKFEYRKP